MIRHVFLLWLAVAAASAASAQDRLAAYPRAITLEHGLDHHRLISVLTNSQGMTTDVTRDVVVTFEPTGIARYQEGRVLPVRDGTATALIRHGSLQATTKVTVQNAIAEPPVSFRHDVIPILTRSGCNSGACHGAAAGKNGFALTLFGYDPARDLRALTRDYRARRLDCADPDQSLILTKPAGIVRHKGGKRLEANSEMWETVRSWIADGARDDGAAQPAQKGKPPKKPLPTLVRLQVEPRELALPGPKLRAAIVVTAEYSDGSLRDVTDLSLLSSSNTTSATIEDGMVTSHARGEAFVMARFGYLTEVAQVLVLPDGKPWQAPPTPSHNEIDQLIQRKLRKLRIAQAAPCDDATFLRRVFVDVIGKLPSVAEARAFLADAAPDKRVRIVDELLQRPEFFAVWAMSWAEVLRIEEDNLETKGVHLFTRWLREALQDRVPMDEIVRRMLTASGSAFSVPEANYWVTARDPKVLAENAAQTFLGIRLQCAQCHNHPFERWRMDDYYGFAAFFTRVGRKASDDPRDTILFDRSRGEINNARTKRPATPRFLGGETPKISPATGRRAVLAKWLTSPKNPWFAKNLANRVWARFFGRGLVHPVDDVRTSNPPSHPDLHRRIGEQLAANDFDIRHLVRQICASATYQASQHPDEPPIRTYAGMTPRRLSAEQLIDAIGSVSEVETKFRGVPLGSSAVQVVDADGGGNRFLDLFGRPPRDSVCACERREEPTLSQVLHLINGDTIERKVRSNKSRLTRLLSSKASDGDILDELCLAAYGRPPRTHERERVLRTITKKDRAAAWQDVLWAMCNSKEFLFQH